MPPSPADDPPDDFSISNEAVLWRRIPHYHFVPMPDGGLRPSSAAFEDDPKDGDPMSTVLARIDRDPFPVLLGNVGWGMVSISVRLIRELGLVVQRRPLPEEPDHVVVIGHKTGGKRKRIVRECLWVIPPPSMR
jgi:hypothetical protein